MVDSSTIETDWPPHKVVDCVAFIEKEFGKIRAVLTGDSSNKSFLSWLHYYWYLIDLIEIAKL